MKRLRRAWRWWRSLPGPDPRVNPRPQPEPVVQVVPERRFVGTCGLCAGPLLRSDGEGAACPCGATTIPEVFMRRARGAGTW